jgi:hypothetical protein
MPAAEARMAKKKPRKLTAAKLVKSAARAHLGTPPPSRLLPDKRREKAGKHKPTLDELIRGE